MWFTNFQLVADGKLPRSKWTKKCLRDTNKTMDEKKRSGHNTNWFILYFSKQMKYLASENGVKFYF